MSMAVRLPADTDELPEGSTNQYHTSARAISAVEGEATLVLNAVDADTLNVGNVSGGQYLGFDASGNMTSYDPSGSAFLYFDVDGTAGQEHKFRFGRFTDTTGSVGIQLFAGDATTNLGAFISGNGSENSFLCGQGGSLGIGTTPSVGMVDVAPDLSSIHGIYVNMPASSGGKIAFYGNVNDNGTSTGGRIFIGRNNNASTPAPGSFSMQDSTGTSRTIWSDDSGNLRISGLAGVTSAQKSSGTVVGTQTSSKKFKDLHGKADAAEWTYALQRVIRTAQNAIHNFTYKNGSFGGQLFRGIVIEDAPWYGMDKDADHPFGKSLNEADLFGDLVMAQSAVYDLVIRQGQRIDELEKRLAEVEKGYADGSD